MLLTQLDLTFDELGPFLAGVGLIIGLITAIGAIRPTRARDLLGATAASVALVLPFILLELINRRVFNEEFPFGLFAILWVVAFSFILILRRVMSDLRSRGTARRRPLSTTVRLASLVFLAWSWVALIQDQMPCFLGVPLCD